MCNAYEKKVIDIYNIKKNHKFQEKQKQKNV